MKTILIINPGSTSKKYSLYASDNLLLSAHFELCATEILATYTFRQDRVSVRYELSDYDQILDLFIAFAKEQNLIAALEDITHAAVRIVAPGTYFASHRLIDDEFISRLLQAKEQAELHIKPVQNEIDLLRDVLPEAELYAISDSAFHASRPAVSKEYAIDYRDAEHYDIYRFGYHGLSLQSVVNQMPEVLGNMPSRVVVAHLGGGASVTAIKDGKSLETSMGFSPVEGLIMAKRSGDIDPLAAVYLAEQKGYDYKELDHYLTTHAGLLGLSAHSADVRVLLELEEDGDERATIALDSFAYRVKQYIGKYMAVLGGIDALVFTATIGIRSDIMRARIVGGLEDLGILLDLEKNSKTITASSVVSSDSSVPIIVMHIDEMSVMHEALKNLT